MAAIPKTSAIQADGLKSQGFATNCDAILRESRSIIVIDAPPKIDAKHGLSPRERDLLTEGIDQMRRHGPGLFVSIENGREIVVAGPGTGHGAETGVRSLASRIRSDIAQHQRRSGMRKRHAVTVFEALGRDGRPKFNAHIVAIARDTAHRDKIITALNSSETYGRSILAKPVENWDELTKYLLKEATPQAAYRKQFRRISGSIPLGALGGNRVILSEDLKSILLTKKMIEPYSRTYASRPLPQPTIAIAAEPDPRGLFGELPEQAQPVKQWVRTGPRRLKLVVKAQVNMALDRRPDVVELMAKLGPTHQAIATRLGTSRPQVTNIINRQFGCSHIVARRVLELAMAA